MGLYLENGYLNQKWIQSTADRNGISFIVEIGGRQVGKTFGTLQLMLENKNPFILMRRTTTETDFICNDVNNPFTVFDGYSITVKKDNKYTAGIYNHEGESDPQYIGAVMALSTVAKIRGFNGSVYTDLVFDEFIPENHVMKIRNEGDAFLNAVVTVSGAREENGKKPLRVWLLANPNTIDNPILQALNISTKVEDMGNRGQEVSIMPDRGIMIVRPNSTEILNKRKNNALFKAIGKGNKFTGMALENEFSYNDSSDVARIQLNEYSLVLTFGDIGFYKHKSRDIIYCVDFIKGTPKENRAFTDSDQDAAYIRRNFPELRTYFVQRCMVFCDLTVKARVIDLLL